MPDVIIKEERAWLDGEEHLVIEVIERPSEAWFMPLTLANKLAAFELADEFKPLQFVPRGERYPRD